jgi:hypothetical protein
MASRGFTDEERAAFVDGAAVLVGSKGAAWAPEVVVGGIVPDSHGEERVKTTFVPGNESFEHWSYPTGIRVPGAVEGFDFQWTTGPDGERVPAVLFCRECGDTDGQVGVSRHRKTGRGDGYYDTVPVSDTAHIDDYVFTCTKCTNAVGGWITYVPAREYARRLAAVREMGYLPESATWTRKRANDALQGQIRKEWLAGHRWA